MPQAMVSLVQHENYETNPPCRMSPWNMEHEGEGVLGQDVGRHGAYTSVDAARANDVEAEGRLTSGPAIGSQKAHLLGLPGLQDHALAHGQRVGGVRPSRLFKR